MRWLDTITDPMDINLEQTPGAGEGQGSLVCWSPWGHKELVMTELQNGEGNGNPLQYSCLENPTGRGAC